MSECLITLKYFFCAAITVQLESGGSRNWGKRGRIISLIIFLEKEFSKNRACFASLFLARWSHCLQRSKVESKKQNEADNTNQPLNHGHFTSSFLDDIDPIQSEHVLGPISTLCWYDRSFNAVAE